jgi:hypothetical protein
MIPSVFGNVSNYLACGYSTKELRYICNPPQLNMVLIIQQRGSTEILKRGCSHSVATSFYADFLREFASLRQLIEIT